MSLTGEPGGPPIRPGTSIGDIAAGLYATVGILSALHERETSGQGQYVDVAMLDCQLAIQEGALSRFFATGEVPGPIGTRHPIFTPFQAFQASDGWLVLAIVGGRVDQWPLFCATIDRIDLIDHPNYKDGWSRTEHYQELAPSLEEALEKRPVAEWITRFREVGIACGPINRIDQVAVDPQVKAREMVVDVADPSGNTLKVVNNPVKFSRSLLDLAGTSPGLGADTTRILTTMLELDEREVEALRSEGVL